MKFKTGDWIRHFYAGDLFEVTRVYNGAGYYIIKRYNGLSKEWTTKAEKVLYG